MDNVEAIANKETRTDKICQKYVIEAYEEIYQEIPYHQTCFPLVTVKIR